MNTAAFSFCKTWLASDYLEMSIFTASQYFVGAQAWSSMFFWGHLFFFRLNSFTLPADDVVIVISWTQLLVFVEVNGSPAFKRLAAALQLHPKQVYPGTQNLFLQIFAVTECLLTQVLPLWNTLHKRKFFEVCFQMFKCTKSQCCYLTLWFSFAHPHQANAVSFFGNFLCSPFPSKVLLPREAALHHVRSTEVH